MLKAYKYRLYPNKSQQILIEKTFGCVRFIYNKMLADKKEYYEKEKKTLWITPAQYKNEFIWLKEVDSMALCNAQINLQSAYSNFFKSISKQRKRTVEFPKFKTKKKSKLSYTTNNINNSIRLQSINHIQLPKVGTIYFEQHREFNEKIKSCNISRNGNKYYISILVDQLPKIVEKEVGNKVVGIDIGFETFATLSTGEKINHPRFLDKSAKKLARANRTLHKRVLGSKNREQQRFKVNTIHHKISNQRKDFLHKLSRRLVTEFDVIVVEDIDLTIWAKRKKGRKFSFGKSVADSGFGMFRTFCGYKAEEELKTFIKAPRFFASSQLCSICGYKNAEVKNLSVRNWVCPQCGKEHDRDSNAAKNLELWYRNTVATTGIHGCGEITSTLDLSNASSFVETSSPCL